MCLIVVGVGATPRYPLLVAANRDEQHSRAAAAAAWWPQPPLLGGRDLQAGGAWLAVDRRGRFAAVTNIRDPQRRAAARSRGSLVADFFAGDASAAVMRRAPSVTARSSAHSTSSSMTETSSGSPAIEAGRCPRRGAALVQQRAGRCRVAEDRQRTRRCRSVVGAPLSRRAAVRAARRACRIGAAGRALPTYALRRRCGLRHALLDRRARGRYGPGCVCRADVRRRGGAHGRGAGELRGRGSRLASRRGQGREPRGDRADFLGADGVLHRIRVPVHRIAERTQRPARRLR